MGESEAVVLVVVLGVEVAGDGGRGIPDEANLEGYAGRRGGLDFESGAIDGEVLAQEVIGGLSEVLKAEKRVRNEVGTLGIAVPSRRVELVEEEPFGFSREEEGLWVVASSRSIPMPAFMPGAPSREKLARFTPRSGRTKRWSSRCPRKNSRLSSRAEPATISS